ncbi:MAG: gamma-glutamyl-gamma-aminobutyrate hydrolase family protein [Deltaproteobacteria bacterium]|nr:gamma-glutamyl-gamma-aminobutyrate hydrolase family protein [Deltaproteobacteria bacterium]
MSEEIVRVGLTLDEEGEGAELRYRLKGSYVEAVRRAGGLPIALPRLGPGEVEAALDGLSALVITGGAFDVPPEAYGEAPREGLGRLLPERTASETLLGRLALERGLPLLGVCGGMQLLNVLCGGTLVQDIVQELPGAHPHEQEGDRGQPSHPLEVAAGTRLHALLAPADHRANSTHHQAVARVGEGLVVSARADDGVIEAIERPGEPFVLGVQWHPELLAGSCPSHQRIYDALVLAARGR